MKKLTYNAILLALALGLSFAERWLPISLLVPLPGIKLGLANIVTMYALFYLDFGSAVSITVLRCILAALLYGGVTGFLFSLSGGVLALIVMWLMRRRHGTWFSFYGISITGAAAHNVGQIGAAVLLMKTSAVLSYLPVLLFAALITGTLTGTLAELLFPRLKKAGI